MYTFMGLSFTVMLLWVSIYMAYQNVVDFFQLFALWQLLLEKVWVLGG